MNTEHRNETEHVSGGSYFFQKTAGFMMSSKATYTKRVKKRTLPTLEEYLIANPNTKIEIQKCPTGTEMRKACVANGCAWMKSLDILRNPDCARCKVRKAMIAAATCKGLMDESDRGMMQCSTIVKDQIDGTAEELRSGGHAGT